MPSPESPQNRTVAASSSTTRLERVVVAMEVVGSLRRQTKPSSVGYGYSVLPTKVDQGLL
jgi:hypothetical protein